MSHRHYLECCRVTLMPLCSGAQKLQSFNVTTGGPVMSLMAPKMDTFLGHIKDITHIDVPLEKVRGLPMSDLGLTHTLQTSLCKVTAPLLHLLTETETQGAAGALCAALGSRHLP